MVGAEQAFVPVAEWLARPAPVDRGRSLAELARRYLAGHGPADARDLAKWAGLPLRDARTALGSIAGVLRERPDGLVEIQGRRRSAAVPPPRLLGSFDPVLFGWRSRSAVLAGAETVVTRNGVYRPFALVEGRAAGTWSLTGDVVRLAPFAPLAPAVTAALATEAAAGGRYLGASGESRLVVDPPGGNRG